ncbi:MAG: transposase domain-containing protein [Methylotetracoccus sp.]
MAVYTIQQIAAALGITRPAADKRAKRERWPFTGQGDGKARLFNDIHLPSSVQVDLALKYAAEQKPENPLPDSAPLDKPRRESDPEYLEQLNQAWTRKTSKQRAKAQQQAEILHQVYRLYAAHNPLSLGERAAATCWSEAMRTVGAATGTPWKTIRNWWNGAGNKPGCRRFDRAYWPLVLASNSIGRLPDAEISPAAWDFFCTLYLDRRKPSLADTHRRTVEAGASQGWAVPSERTLDRMVRREFSRQTLTYWRQGDAALKELYPWQHRDKTVFKAGEAVSGDGLKFDTLYIAFDDEVLNTATGWFWQDLYSGKILAYRLGKTENTDLFRLSVWDLTDICVPHYMQIDNTRVAANKVMTGGVANRFRFKDQPNDPMGALIQLGIDVHFTNPDQRVNSPGSKPVERAFGIGGLHEKVRTSPRIKDRGYNKATAIPFDEFREIVAEEVVRHNAQPKRRSAVCQGLYSFDEVFARSFVQAAPRKASEQQRQVLLLLPEVLRADAKSGQLALKAGRGPKGKNRYWCEELVEYAGQEVVAYYDPQALHAGVMVYSLDGKKLCDAAWIPSTGFTDTDTAREWAKNKQRALKANRLEATAVRRMNALELTACLPERKASALPEANVVTGLFGAAKLPHDSVAIDRESGEVIDAEASFIKAAKRMDALLKR